MTEQEIIEDFKRQHLKTYKKAVMEIIKNNTSSLVEEDIFSLIKKPPLDSMDLLKLKLLELAKRQRIVLDVSGLNNIVSEFRNLLQQKLAGLKSIRQEILSSKVEEFEPKRESEIITITTKDLSKVNQKLKKEVKAQIKVTVEMLSENLDSIYHEDVLEEQKILVNEQFLKYMRGPYQKQMLENISMKTLIKDRTLSSGVNEQGERYLFTKMNSHIFDESK